MKRDISQFKAVNTETGESYDIEEFIKDYLENNKKVIPGFELTYPKELNKYFSCAKNASTTILLYLLKVKTNFNLVVITQQMIIDETGVSKNTVAKVMKELQQEDMLRKLRNGVYVLNPKISVRGGNCKWAAFDNWEKGGNQ